MESGQRPKKAIAGAVVAMVSASLLVIFCIYSLIASIITLSGSAAEYLKILLLSSDVFILSQTFALAGIFAGARGIIGASFLSSKKTAGIVLCRRWACLSLLRAIFAVIIAVISGERISEAASIAAVVIAVETFVFCAIPGIIALFLFKEPSWWHYSKNHDRSNGAGG